MLFKKKFPKKKKGWVAGWASGGPTGRAKWASRALPGSILRPSPTLVIATGWARDRLWAKNASNDLAQLIFTTLDSRRQSLCNTKMAV